MEIPANPLAVLTFISAPAVLTNASCVLLFGTGNRYGRAVDRVHELAEMVETAGRGEAELRLRIRQLDRPRANLLLHICGFVCGEHSSVTGGRGTCLVRNSWPSTTGFRTRF